MKGLIKLFSAAAVVGALASCSDDLSSLKVGGIDPNADLVATLVTSDGDDATRVAVLEDKTVVWNKGDMVKTYCPGKLAFNTFILDSGEGTTTGNFKDYQIQDESMKTRTDLVAITSSELVKGVHATDEKFPKLQLIAKIPWQFDQNQANVVDEEGDPTSELYYPLAIPYWGSNVSFNDDNQIQANMKPLAALVKIDIAALPKGTRAIVLTTHNSVRINGTTYNNNGNDEALSGTLTAVLEPGAKLAIDEDYKHRDTIRVNIPELETAQDKVIFVPLVAQHYDKLTILAVKGDDANTYSWPDAEELKVLEDVTINVFTRYTIAETAPVYIAETSPAAISKAIAELKANDPKHRLNAVVTGNVVATADDYTIFIADNLPGKEDVQITFVNPIDLTAAPNKQLWIVEADGEAHMMDIYPYSWHVDAFLNPVNEEEDIVGSRRYSRAKERDVILNFASGQLNKIRIELPTSDVEVYSENSPAAKFWITGSATSDVSGYTDSDHGWKTPVNKKDAGITLRGTLGDVHITKFHINMKGNNTHGGGAVYAFGDGIDDEITNLYFEGELACDLRITDMLIGLIDYKKLQTGQVSYIYTTGNAAIKTVTENNNLARREKISLNASWTGKVLSQAAYTKGYNQEQIYTAAQLQGMKGDAATWNYQGTTKITYEMNNIVKSVWLGDDQFPWVGAVIECESSPVLFNGKNTNFRNMKLIVKDPFFRPTCCCDEFVPKLDEGIGLIRRIVVEGDDTEAALGTYPGGDTPTSDVSEGNAGAVIVENVDLFDVYLEDQIENVDNIGAITGRITAVKGGVVLQDNAVHDVRITAKHDNIGGAFGKVEAKKNIEIKKLTVAESSSNPGVSFVESNGKNIGGAIGLITTDAKAQAQGVFVLEEYVVSKNNNVGGQVGQIQAKQIAYDEGTTAATGTIGSNEVEIMQKIYTVGSNVGGLIGRAFYQDGVDSWIRGTVTCPVIRADKNAKMIKPNYYDPSGSQVGGLVGVCRIEDAAVNGDNLTAIEGSVDASGAWTFKQDVDKKLTEEEQNKGAGIYAMNEKAGGFVGRFEANQLRTAFDNYKNDNTVTIGTLEATEGFAGGLYGNIETSAESFIGNQTTNHNVKVTIGLLKAAYAGGGEVGYNADTKLNIQSKKTKGTSHTVTVKMWENTVATRALALIDLFVPSTYQDAFDYISSYFSNMSDMKFYGSFATLVGFMNSALVMNDDNIVITAEPGVLATLDQVKFDGTGYTQSKPVVVKSKNPMLTDFMKWQLLFPGGKVSAATEILEHITGQGLLMWGDEFGYVGIANNSANNTGCYKLNGTSLQGSVHYHIYRNYLPVTIDEFKNFFGIE